MTLKLKSATFCLEPAQTQAQDKMSQFHQNTVALLQCK